MEVHRGTGQEPLPTDSELCQAIVVLARAHHDTIWARTKAIQHLRVASPEARAVPTISRTPAPCPACRAGRYWPHPTPPGSDKFFPDGEIYTY